MLIFSFFSCKKKDNAFELSQQNISTIDNIYFNNICKDSIKEMNNRLPVCLDKCQIKIHFVDKKAFEKALYNSNYSVFSGTYKNRQRVNEDINNHIIRNGDSLIIGDLGILIDQKDKTGLLCNHLEVCPIEYFLSKELSDHYLVKVFFEKQPLTMLYSKKDLTVTNQLPFTTIANKEGNILFSIDQCFNESSNIYLYQYKRNIIKKYEIPLNDTLCLLRPFFSDNNELYAIYIENNDKYYVKIHYEKF